MAHDIEHTKYPESSYTTVGDSSSEAIVIDAEPERRPTLLEVSIAKYHANELGLQYNGAVRQFVRVGVDMLPEGERAILERLANSFSLVDTADEAAVKHWFDNTAEGLVDQIVDTIVDSLEAKGETVDAERLDQLLKNSRSLLVDMWHEGLLEPVGGKTARKIDHVEANTRYTSNDEQRGNFLEYVEQYKNALATVRELEDRREAIPARHQELLSRMTSHLETERGRVLKMGAGYGGLVWKVGSVPEAALSADEIGNWGASYRQEILSVPDSEWPDRWQEWANQIAGRVVADAANLEGSRVQVDDENAIHNVTILLADLTDGGVFDDATVTDSFVTAVGEYRHAKSQLKNSAVASAQKILRGLIAVGKRVKNFVVVADAQKPELVKPSRRQVLATLGLVGVVYTIVNRVATGIEYGAHEIFSLHNWDFGIFSSNPTAKGTESEPQPESASQVSLSAEHLGSDVGDASAKGETGIPSEDSAIEEPSTSGYTMTETAGRYGAEGENPGSLTGFAKQILAEHGIDSPSRQQTNQVLSVLIDNNETHGADHQIIAGQVIELGAAHDLVDSWATPAEASTEIENTALPSDWPDGLGDLTAEQVNTLDIESGGTGEQLVAGLGFSAEDWNRIAPDLQHAHPDMVYAVGIDSHGGVVDANSNEAVSVDYRLRKRGYPSWSFVETLFDLLLGNK